MSERWGDSRQDRAALDRYLTREDPYSSLTDITVITSDNQEKEMSKTQTDRQKIREDHPDSWIAVNEGDTIAGKVTDVTEAWSAQRRDPVTGRPGSLYPLLTILADEATGYDDLPRELKVHAFGAVLFNEIMRKQPNVGEGIRVTYKGQGEAKPNQNPPELYVVRAAAGSETAQRAYAQIGGPGVAPRGGEPVQPELAADQAADDIPF